MEKDKERKDLRYQIQKESETENYNYLQILEGDIIKHVEVKNKNKKE